MRIRPLTDNDLPRANAMILASKSHWGYSPAFITACKDALTVTVDELQRTACVGLFEGETLIGMSTLIAHTSHAELDKLFIDPEHIGKGAGKRLYQWAIHTTKTLGLNTIQIDADPHAADFYAHCGAEHRGFVASTVEPGRELPFFVHTIDEAS
ncbi:MAG: GNAT family N-acetyltransferase [Pseudomonadota bacterium]